LSELNHIPTVPAKKTYFFPQYEKCTLQKKLTPAKNDLLAFACHKTGLLAIEYRKHILNKTNFFTSNEWDSSFAAGCGE
jgi:hypothetical protein